MRTTSALLTVLLAACATDDAIAPSDDGLDLGPTVPRAFHIVHIDDRTSYDAVRALADADMGPMIASQNRPADLPPSRWARNVSPLHYTGGVALADAVHEILSGPDAPAIVMIDELRGDFIDTIAVAARRLRTLYPQHRGRWGVYVVHGEGVAYTRLQPAIDEILDAGATVAAELYAQQSHYCASGATAGARDAWLGDFFRGSRGRFPDGRFHWLMQRRATRGSDSHITVLFGVTDRFLDGAAPAVFLDRMFYVWATRSGYPSLLTEAWGGPGAWKWDAPFDSNTSRDLAFAESFEHYVVSGRRDSRLGQVTCP